MTAWLDSVAQLLTPLAALQAPLPPAALRPLRDLLAAPDSAPHVRRHYDALQDLLHEARLPELGAAQGSPVDYCQWLFRRLMAPSSAPALKLHLLTQLERLLASLEPAALDAYAALVLVNLVPLVEAPQPPELLLAAVALMRLLAARAPARFAPHLSDYADVLLGWRLQLALLPPALRRALDALLRHALAPLWRAHAALATELLAKLADDLAAAPPPPRARALLACAAAFACALAPCPALAARVVANACTALGAPGALSASTVDAQEEEETHEALRSLAALVAATERGPLQRLLTSAAVRAPPAGPPLPASSVCAALASLTELLPLLDAPAVAALYLAPATPLALLRAHASPAVLRSVAALARALAAAHPPFLPALVTAVSAALAPAPAAPAPAPPPSAIAFDALLALATLPPDALAPPALLWLSRVAEQPARHAALGAALLSATAPRLPPPALTDALVPLLAPAAPASLLAAAVAAAGRLPPPLSRPLLAALRALLAAPEQAPLHDAVAALLLAGDGDAADLALLLWRWAERPDAAAAALPAALAFRASPVTDAPEAPPALLPDVERPAPPPADWLPRLLAAVAPAAPPEALAALDTLTPPPPTPPDEWLADAIAAHAVAKLLRSALGGPAQTLEALEKAVVEQARRVAAEGGRSAARAPSLLLALADRLQRGMYVAAEGAVSAPPPARAAAAFFRANRRVCDEWVARLRPPLLPLARHAAAPHHLIAHAAPRLLALLARPPRDPAEALRTLYFAAEALLEAGDAAAVAGLAAWAPLEGTRAWLAALADEAAGRHEAAAAALQALLLAPAPPPALAPVAALLAGRVAPLLGALGEQAAAFARWQHDAAALRPLAPLGPRAALLALAAASWAAPATALTAPAPQRDALLTEVRLLVRVRAPLPTLVPAVRLLAALSPASAPSLASVPLAALAPPAAPDAWLAAAPLVRAALSRSEPCARPAALLLARRHVRAGNVRAAARWLAAAGGVAATRPDDAVDELCTRAALAASPTTAVALLVDALPGLARPTRALLRLARLLLAEPAPDLPGALAAASHPLLSPGAPPAFAAAGAYLEAARDADGAADAKLKAERRLALWAFAAPAHSLDALLAAPALPAAWPPCSAATLAALRRLAHDPVAVGLQRRVDASGAALERDATREGAAAAEASAAAAAWDEWRAAHVIAPFRLALAAAASVLRAGGAASDWPLALRLLRLLHADLPPLRPAMAELATLPAAVWLSLLPQLFATLRHPAAREPLASLVQAWLGAVARLAPHLVLFPVLAGGAPLAPLEAQLRAERAAAVAEAGAVRHELVRVAVLDEERWLLELSRVHALLTAGRLPARPLAARLARLLDAAADADAPLAPHTRAFRRHAHPLLARALEALRTSDAAGDEAWAAAGLKALQHSLLARVHSWGGRLPLAALSPRLAALRSASLSFATLQSSAPGAVRVAGFGAEVQLLPTKTRPKRVTVLSDGGAAHAFLLKGRDELALDQRMLQFLHLANLLLAAPPAARHSAPPLRARTYAVTPLAPRVGLIEMVPHCVSLFAVYRQWRRRRAHHEPVRPADEFHARLVPLLRERGVSGHARADWPRDLLRRVFEQLRAAVPADLLARELHAAAASPRAHLGAVAALARGAGTMSALGYVAGLGDRHADNVLVDLTRGAVLHIDHNVCLDAGLRLRVPEVVPFRLTHTLERAFGPSGVHGAFTESACAALAALRRERASLVLLFDTLRDEPRLDWGAARADAARASAERAVSLGLIAARLADLRPALAAARDHLAAPLRAAAALLTDATPLYAPALAEARHTEALAAAERRALERVAAVEEAVRAAQSEQARLAAEGEAHERDEAACRAALADAAAKCARWQERHEAAVARFSALATPALRSERVRRALDAYQRAVLARAPPDWSAHNRHAEWHALLADLLRAPSVPHLDALHARLSPPPPPPAARDPDEEDEAHRDLARAQARLADAARALDVAARRGRGPWALLALQEVMSAAGAGDEGDALHVAQHAALLQPALEAPIAPLAAVADAVAALATHAAQLVAALAAETARALASADASVAAALAHVQRLAAAASLGALAGDEAARAWQALSSHGAAAGGALLVAAHAALLVRPEAPLAPYVDASALAALAPTRLHTLAALLPLLGSPAPPPAAHVAAVLAAYHRALCGAALAPALHLVRDHTAALWLDETPPDEQAAAEAFVAAAAARLDAAHDVARAQGRVQTLDDERREAERSAALQPGAVRDALLAELGGVADEPEAKGVRALLDFEAHRFASEPRAAALDAANAALLQRYRRSLLTRDALAAASHRAEARADAAAAELAAAKAELERAQSERRAAASARSAARWADAATALAAPAALVAASAALPAEAEAQLSALESLCRGVDGLAAVESAARAARSQHSRVCAQLEELGAQLVALAQGAFPVAALAPLALRLPALCADLDALHALLAAAAHACVQQVGAVPSAAEAREEAVPEAEDAGGSAGSSSEASEGDEALSGTAFSAEGAEAEGAGGAESEQERSRQDEVLRRVADKLAGVDALWCAAPAPLPVRAQVDALIRQAAAADNLAAMYEGWAAWI